MKKLKELTGLSSKELMIIGFLLLSFLAGLVIKYSGWKEAYQYDYSESDAGFESKIKSSFTELKQQPIDSLQRQRAEELNQLADSIGMKIESETNKMELPAGTVININTALSGDLTRLPGIGEVMAERIIDYRTKHGGFKSTEELMNVKGIGEKKFEKIKENVTVK